MQNNLSWTSQITDLSLRMMKMAGMFGRNAMFLSKDILEVICHSLIFGFEKGVCELHE